MKVAAYSFPHKTLFGSGSSLNLAGELPFGAKVLVVAGTTVARSPSVRKVLETIGSVTCTVYTGVPPEPPLETVDEIISIGRKFMVNTVVAIGGGSVIDAAKAAAALIPVEGLTADYFFERLHIQRKGLFFAALPTTAGTGAEATNNSVLTDKESKIKKSLRHPSMVADTAIIDPDLTLTCPANLTAASGLDAFVQAFESFTSPKASSLTKALSAEAVRKIFSCLETACKEPENICARVEMAEASMLSGMAFSQTGLGAVHGLAHPAGSLLGVPHGLACAILMRPVMEFNMQACADQYADLADRSFIGSDARTFVRMAGELAEKLNVPENLRSFALHRSDFDFIIKNCRSASMKQNPREMTDKDVEAILEKML